MLWSLWKARDKLCFEVRRFFIKENVVKLKAISDAKEWKEAQQADSISRSTNCTRAIPSSLVPSVNPGTVIGHVDALWYSTTFKCGMGWVFSGDPTYIQLPFCYVSRSHVSSVLMAEALVVRSTVIHATSSNVKSLMILSVSFTPVHLLQGRESRPDLFGILFDIYCISSDF